MNGPASLDMLPVGRGGTVAALATGPDLHRRLLSLGLTPGTQVLCLGRSPAGDPSAYLIRGTVIALRGRDARGVLLAAPGGEEARP